VWVIKQCTERLVCVLIDIVDRRVCLERCVEHELKVRSDACLEPTSNEVHDVPPNYCEGFVCCSKENCALPVTL
jgi:hypothetical protein